MKRKESLRLRLTALTGGIMLTASVLLALLASYNARDKFVEAPYLITGSVPAEQINVVTEAEPKDAQTVEDQEENEEKMMLLTATVTEAKRDFDIWNYIFLALISLLGMGATWFFVGRALEPVKTLSETVAQLDEKQLSQRLPVPKRADEIGSLTRSFNGMLDRLEESFQRQKRFASSAAHELKTPLTTIKAGIEVLQLEERPEREELESVIDVTKTCTERLIQIVEDLLALTREQLEQEEAPVDLLEQAREIQKELAPLYQERGLTVAIQDGAAWTQGNLTLLHQLLYNLMDNAMKYNVEGGSVQVTARREGEMVALQVKDSGIGMEEEEIGRIFEPFYRVDPSRSKRISGSGLGLSIVKTIAQAHGGWVEVESRKGEGTLFTLTLPAKRPPQPNFGEK